MSKYKVSEIFGPTIQGEGPEVGKKVMFIRLSGCDFNCSWCDTQDVHTKGQLMYGMDIINEIERLSKGSTKHIIISGGNPAIYELEDLLGALKELKYKVSIETQGSIVKGWFKFVDTVIVSPKPISSGMNFKIKDYINNIDMINGMTNVFVKIPIGSGADFEFAKEIKKQLPSNVPLYLSVVNTMWNIPNISQEELTMNILRDYKKVVNWVIEDREMGSDVHVIPQMHTLVWGNKKGV